MKRFLILRRYARDRSGRSREQLETWCRAETLVIVPSTSIAFSEFMILISLLLCHQLQRQHWILHRVLDLDKLPELQSRSRDSGFKPPMSTLM